MVLSIRFTYTISTPESAESRDYADSGFCNEFGTALTNRESDLDELADELIEHWTEIGDLEYCIRRAIALGINEPSRSIVDSKTWFSSVDPDTNYTTGEEKYYSLHISGLTDSEMSEVYEMLKQGYLSDNNEYWLENLEEQILASVSQ